MSENRTNEGTPHEAGTTALGRRLISNALRYRPAKVEDTKFLAPMRHDADLLPLVTSQLRALLSGLHRDAHVEYDIQGMRDEGTDVLVRLTAANATVFVCLQVKSHLELAAEEQVNSLRLQQSRSDDHYGENITYLNTLVQIGPGESHLAVLDAGHAWTHDPDGLSRKHLSERTVPVARNIAKVASDHVAPAGGGDVPTGLTATEVRATGRPYAASPGPAATAPGGAGRLFPKQLPCPSRSPGPSRLGSTLGDELMVEQWAADVWVDVGRSIDPRLIVGADWSGLAAALDRASRAGYDVQQHLPRLAARSPLPEVRPARALHYRLVEECEAAITPVPQRLRQADAETQTAAARVRLDVEGCRLDNQCVTRPTAPAGADQPNPDRTGWQPTPATPPARPAAPAWRGPQR